MGAEVSPACTRALARVIQGSQICCSSCIASLILAKLPPMGELQAHSQSQSLASCRCCWDACKLIQLSSTCMLDPLITCHTNEVGQLAHRLKCQLKMASMLCGALIAPLHAHNALCLRCRLAASKASCLLPVCLVVCCPTGYVQNMLQTFAP